MFSAPWADLGPIQLPRNPPDRPSTPKYIEFGLQNDVKQVPRMMQNGDIYVFRLRSFGLPGPLGQVLAGSREAWSIRPAPARCVRPVSRHTTSSKKIGPKSRARALPRPSPAADLAPRRRCFFPGPVFEPCRFSDRFLDRLLVTKWSQNACQK